MATAPFRVLPPVSASSKACSRSSQAPEPRAVASAASEPSSTERSAAPTAGAPTGGAGLLDGLALAGLATGARRAGVVALSAVKRAATMEGSACCSTYEPDGAPSRTIRKAVR